MAKVEESLITIPIIPPGCLVRLKDGKTKGRITAVMIEDDYHVSYRVTWWNNLERRCDWVQNKEVELIEPEALLVGFPNRP